MLNNPKPLDSQSESNSSSIHGGADVPTIIPFYYEDKSDISEKSQSSSIQNSNADHNEYQHKSHSLARQEIDLFLGIQDDEPNHKSHSLARQEIDLFLGIQEDEAQTKECSLARQEIDTYLGIQKDEQCTNEHSLARQEIDTYLGIQKDDPHANEHSLARQEIDSYLGLLEDESNYRSNSLARQEIDIFHQTQRRSKRHHRQFNQNIPLRKVPSLPKKEIDIFRGFQENEIIEVEIFPKAIFKCLYSTENDPTFQNFVSEMKIDSFSTVHFKKSMIYEKFFCLCTEYHTLLIPYESTDQINEVLSQIQNSKVFCISEKDRDQLSNFENHTLINSYATNEELQILRETLHARINERFEVFNTAQSVMICHQITYMSFFYLTEEVISTYYDLKTKGHKFLKTEGRSIFSNNSIPANEDNIPKFHDLYESLEEKIKALHSSVNDTDSYNGVQSSLADINDMLQVTAQQEKEEGLADCINTYQKANEIIKEANDSVNNYLNSSSSPQTSGLPSLNRKSTRNISQSSEKEEENSEIISMKDEIKNLKYDVDSLQNQINDIDQQIRTLNGSDFTLSKSYNNSPRRKLPREPLPQSNSPTARTITPSSPRAMRNRLKSMQKKIDEGDTNAMYSLGACYALGDGVPEDKKKALYYYDLAAERGNRSAQYAAAACYSYGKGTEIDKNKAFKLYLSAAEQGHPKAQFAVGHFYEYGQGGAEKNHEKAKEWYRKAAEQGHTAAKGFLEDCSSENHNSEE